MRDFALILLAAFLPRECAAMHGRDLPAGKTQKSFTCPSPDGIFPSSQGSCSEAYYECAFNFPIESICPTGQLFDPYDLRCVTETDCLASIASETASAKDATWPLVTNPGTHIPTADSTAGSTPSGYQFTCPSPDGTYAISDQCDQVYYVCASGVPFRKTCTNGQVFHPVNRKCVYLSQCYYTEEPLTSTTTTTPSPNCPFDGHFPIPELCVPHYIDCVSGIAYFANCDNSSIFDPAVLKCVPADLASCIATDAVTTEAATCSPTVPDEPFDCPYDGYFALASQCTNTFVICDDLVPYTQICPGSLLFDSTTWRCVSASAVSCPTTTTAAATVKPFTCPSTNGNFPIPGLCASQYYTCIEGVPYLSVCPGVSIFDPITQRCSTTPSCASTTAEITTTSTPTTSATETPFTCPSTNGNFPIPGQCVSQYYTCIEGKPYPSVCPDSSIFDPATSRCSTTPSCAGTTVPTTTSTPRPTAGSFYCPAVDGNFPVPGQCVSDYYACVDNIPYLMTCPNAAIFDPLTLKCTTPGQASCDGFTGSWTSSTTTTKATANTATLPTTTTKSATTTAATTTTAGAATTRATTPTTTKPAGGPFVCPQPDGQFPNGDDCFTFYQCANGIAHLQQCPSGSVYNPNLMYCDWPENVPHCRTQKVQSV